MLDFGLNIFFEQMDALQERVELLEHLITTSLQERRDAESALQRAEEAYAGLKGEHERTEQVLVKVREELEADEKKPRVSKKKRKEAATNTTSGGATQLFFSFED